MIEPNEDNWTVVDARKFARDYGMKSALCKVCHRPFVWRVGQLEKRPATCGRDRCEVIYANPA